MATDTHVQQAKDHIHLLHSLSLVLLSDLSSSMNSNSSKPSPAVREMPVTRKGKHVGTPRRKSSDVQTWESDCTEKLCFKESPPSDPKPSSDCRI